MYARCPDTALTKMIGTAVVTVIVVPHDCSGGANGAIIILLDRSAINVAVELLDSAVGHVDRAIPRTIEAVLNDAAVTERTFLAPGTVTLNDAAVGDRTVLAPATVTLKLAAVIDVTFRIALVSPETVTLNDAAVTDRTFFAPGITTAKEAAVLDSARTYPGASIVSEPALSSTETGSATVTLKEAAVAERTFLAPATVTLKLAAVTE